MRVQLCNEAKVSYMRRHIHLPYLDLRRKTLGTFSRIINAHNYRREMNDLASGRGAPPNEQAEEAAKRWNGDPTGGIFMLQIVIVTVKTKHLQ